MTHIDNIYSEIFILLLGNFKFSTELTEDNYDKYSHLLVNDGEIEISSIYREPDYKIGRKFAVFKTKQIEDTFKLFGMKRDENIVYGEYYILNFNLNQKVEDFLNSTV